MYLVNKPLITWLPDGTVRYEVQGQPTRTRRELINRYGPERWRIVGVGPDWSVQDQRTGELQHFYDGMEIEPKPIIGGKLASVSSRDDLIAVLRMALRILEDEKSKGA